MNPANDVAAAPFSPKVTAILIVHNQAGELRRSIGALETSEHRDQIEILVVDCASDDSTSEIAEEFPGITMQRLPENFGATKALNIATRTGRGEYLFLLSPDVEVMPDTIRRLSEKLDAEPLITGACPLLVDPNGTPVLRTRPLPDAQSLSEVRRGGDFGWTAIPEENLSLERFAVLYPGREALLIRKQFVAGMNYFDERFGEYWAEADLAIKVRKAGRKLEMYPAIRAIWHPGSESNLKDTTHISDRIVGAAALLGKHHGFMEGFRFRMAAMLGALMRFELSLFAALASGKKVGSQAK